MEGKIDRLAMRGRPSGSPILQQKWENLLFLHWPVDPALLRPLIPEALEIDTFDGRAWLGITPFHLSDLRPPLLPALPGLSAFTEMNVRTYVLHNGKPGIWFFSLDASKLLPAAAARIFFMLPYFKASMKFEQNHPLFNFSMTRSGATDVEFKASWQVGVRLRAPDVESLAFFLVERYCAFAVEGSRVFQIRIYHHPWILDEALVKIESSNAISALGLPEPATEPIVHFSESIEAEIWAPAQVATKLEPEKSNVSSSEHS